MAGKKVQSVVEFKISGDTADLEKALERVREKAEKLDVSKGSTTSIKKLISNIENELLNFKSKTKDNKVDLVDAGAVEKSANRISSLFNKLITITDSLGKTSGFDEMNKDIKAYKKNLEEATNKLEAAKKKQNRVQKDFDAISGKEPIQDYDTKKADYDTKKTKRKQLEDYKKDNKKEYNTLKKAESGSLDASQQQLIQDYEQAISKAKGLDKEIEDLEKTLNSSVSQKTYDELSQDLDNAKKNTNKLDKALKDIESTDPFENLKAKLKEADFAIEDLKDLNDLENTLKQLTPEQIEKLSIETNEFVEVLNKSGKSVSKLKNKVDGEFKEIVEDTKEANKNFEDMRQKLTAFFGMSNSIQLFKRALRESFESVKELDAAMLKIATVSEYDMGDMWSTLPQFTRQANELGVAITEVYDATGLYVQQGLDLVESQGLANETLKMAKIAGMDAAAATDAMTSALRGFNMELNQGSAEKVNDIYSKLAAITASDTQEIATAMSKTASIANNAGASIENTSAFLSMIIETTRESAETAGTALKTVIARFSELKKNPAEIGDVDGEVVDANQIESALRLAGVDLRDAAGQFRNFDDVIIELSGKWDGLDKNTQRYIATMAAGSRQQSRFLALMSDSERLAQLTDAAYNSAGASTGQFNKTLDSLESKLNQLKNAWDTFTQNLMNSELIKFGVDLLTGILETINGITNAFSDMAGVFGTVFSTATIAAIWLALKKGLDVITKSLKKSVTEGLSSATPEASTAGTNTGIQYANNLTQSADKVINPWLQKIKNKMQQVFPNSKSSKTTIGKGITFQKDASKAPMSDKERYTQYTKTKKDGKTLDLRYVKKEDREFVKEYEKNLELAGETAEKTEGNFDKLSSGATKLGGAMMAAGIGCSLLAQEFRKVGDEETAEFLEKTGGWITGIGSALMLLAPIIKMVGGKTREELIKTGKTAMKWAGIMLIIVGVISLIKTVGEAIAKNTPEGKLKALSEATEHAAEEAQKAQEAYSNWLSDKNEYNGLIEAIKETTEGTAAWSEQMDKLQDKIYEMINTYPELAQYLQEDGTFTEKGIQAYNEKLKNEKELKMGMKMTAQVAEDTQRYENERNDLVEERDRELSKYSKDSAEYREKEAYYIAKETELANSYKATTTGAMNYMAQGAGIDGYMSDNISAAMSKNNYEEKLAQRVQSRKEALKGGYDNEQAAEEVGGAIGAIGLGALAVGVANIWNPLGWVALGAAVIGGITWGIGLALSGANLDELQEKYSEAFGIPVDEISEDIKDDADALANAIAEKEVYEEFQKELKNAEAQLFSLGANAQRLLAGDLSLLDQDFSKFGSFEKWKESLKDGLNELSGDAIDNAYEEFREKTKETVDSVNRIFGGKVKFKYQVIGEEIIENNITGLNMSGVDGGQLFTVEKSLREAFGDNTINALNSVMRTYADNQVSVNELIGAYIELGNAATITQKAVAAKKMFENGTQNIKTLAATFMVAEANALSATNQIKEFYMNLSADQMNEIFKNGMTTAQSIMEMGASFTDLNGIVDTTGINFATLSDILNDVKSGILSVDDLTQGFVETLDKLNKADHIVEDTLARIATFKEPTSGRTIGEKTGEISKKLTDLILEGRYGDPALEAYFDFMFGEDAWNNALKDAEYDAEKAMSKYLRIIQTLAEDVKFFDVWKDTASGSGGLWSVDGNTINFDFSVASSYEDLVTRIERVTGWSQQFIETALTDAQIWSKDLKGTIQQLTQVDALNTYLNNLEAVNGKITLDKEQLGKIFDDMSDEVKKKFGYSYDAFEADVARILTEANYTVQTSANQNLSTEDKISNLTTNFKKEHNIDGIIQDVEFSGTAYKSSKFHQKRIDSQEPTEKELEDFLNSVVQTHFSREHFEKKLEEYGWKDLTQSQRDEMYNKAREDYKRQVKDLDLVRNGDYYNTLYVEYSTLKNIVPKIQGAGYKSTDVSDYKNMMSEAMDVYLEQGYSTWEAIKKVEEQFSEVSTMADSFGQMTESFDDSTNGLYGKLEEIFDKNSENYQDWVTQGITEEEAQLVRQADLINQGTIKAMDYLINSGALGDATLKAGYQEYDTDIDAVKHLNKYGIQKTNTQKVGSGSNTNKQWYTAEQLGITGDGKAKSYNLTADEAREMARNTLEQIDFDWMHNFNELGEKITRTLDNLSAEYDLAVKTLSKSTAELTQNLAEQYANMEAEAIVSQAKADAAQQRMQGMLAKNSDLTKYTWYEDGMVKINYDAINAAKADGSLTEKVGILLDELVANAEVINENEALQLEVDTKQADFLEEINNTIIDFENQVRDMVIEAYEEEIDKLEQIDSAINDANSKLIDSIQKSLDRFRKDRENEKTESDIEDKQRRLALLRADTSGANKGEIMALEKEIGEAQEDYTDTLIDQKISALQEQNEEASAQRQEQIDIANEQLKSAKENGLINEEVARLLSADGFKGSALEQLWIGRMEKKGLDKEEWDRELRNIEKQFVEYKSAQEFKNMYTRDGINTDLASKLGSEISEIESSIISAMNGYDIMSSSEIQAAINKAIGEIKGYINENKEPVLDSKTKNKLEKEFNSLLPSESKYLFEKYGTYGDIDEALSNLYYYADVNNIDPRLVEQFLKSKGIQYATGGLNTQTGPAWLDGTPSKPELVLNPTDTQNFLMLKDILSDVMRGGSFTTNQKDGDLNLEIYLNVEQGLSNDYDVEQLVTKVKQEIAKVGRERNIQILTKR